MSNPNTSIYTVLLCSKLEDSKYGPEFGATRLVGYYFDKEAAFRRVKANALDINEAGAYPYVIIEHVEEGMYEPATHGQRWFFECDKTSLPNLTYREIEEPDFCKHFCGFSIG